MISKELIDFEFDLRSGHFLNAAYFGPLPKRTRIALEKAAKQQSWPFGLNYDWVDLPDKFRSLMAKLLKISPSSISYNASTSEVISTIAHGMRFSSTDRIALLQGEYPSDVLPWMQLQSKDQCGIDFYQRTTLIKSPQDFVKALNQNTKVICLSHVCFQTGSMINLSSFLDAMRLHRPDIFIVVDVTQSLGGVALELSDLQRIDVVVGSLYKWLLCPYGQAFAIWSERSMRLIEPIHLGWINMPKAPSSLTDFTTEQKPGARRFDRGQAPNMIALSGTLASLSLFEELGMENIYKHNRSLVSRFLSKLDQRQFSVLAEDTGSCIVCLRSNHVSSEILKAQLDRRNIDISVREGNLRVSFHLFNAYEDVDQLIEAVNQTCSST